MGGKGGLAPLDPLLGQGKLDRKIRIIGQIGQGSLGIIRLLSLPTTVKIIIIFKIRKFEEV